MAGDRERAHQWKRLEDICFLIPRRRPVRNRTEEMEGKRRKGATRNTWKHYRNSEMGAQKEIQQSNRGKRQKLDLSQYRSYRIAIYHWR